jgi:hypothetical protein
MIDSIETPPVTEETPLLCDQNAEKSLALAKGLYPHEKWEQVENGIFIAKSRIPRSADQMNVIEKELRQARILVERGSMVYLLPENTNPHEKHRKYPDAVVDGSIMEFKSIVGSKRQVKIRYKEARAKTTNIFFKIDADLTKQEVIRELSRYIKKKGYAGGTILVYFSKNGELHKWDENELLSL